MAKQRKGFYFGGDATTNGKPFTVGSLNFIKANAGKLPAKSIANILHRPVQAVQGQARKLGVSLSVR